MILRNPEEVRITTLRGEDKKYIIHSFSAYDGRKIVVQYSQNALPKVGEYEVNEQMSLLMMKYVCVETTKDEKGKPTLQPLETKELIENHVPDWETLAKLEIALLKYNTSFFQEGKVSGLLEDFIQTATDKISSMLTDLLERSSQADTRNSEN